MGQRRYFNYLDDDSTFDINSKDVGINPPGLYRGYDFKPTDNMLLTLEHDVTGAVRTLIDKTESAKYGIILTKQGVIIHDDTKIELPINPTTGQARTDLIICQHEYVEVNGGQTAGYLVIEGPPGGVAPALTRPETQIVVAELRLPANCTQLSNTNIQFIKPAIPSYAGNQDFIKRKDGVLLSDLNMNGFKIRNLKAGTTDLDAVNKKQMEDALAARFPAGIVTYWQGTINTIPAGFALCNGQNGTANIIDRFIAAAGGAYEPGATGGEDKVSLKTAELAEHSHGMQSAGSHTHTGGTNSAGSHKHTAATLGSGYHRHEYRDGFYAENWSFGSSAYFGSEYQGGVVPGSDEGHDMDNRWIAYKNRESAYAGTHVHTITMENGGTHSHAVSLNSSGNHTHNIDNTGSGQAHENRPKYYALAPIVRL